MYRRFIFWLRKSLDRKWHCNSFCVTCPYAKRCEYEFKGNRRRYVLKEVNHGKIQTL